MHDRLVGEDAAVADEGRPGPVPPIGMDPVDDGHRRPEREVLRLRRREALLPPASPGGGEERPEHGAVREVNGEADLAPAGTVARQRRAEESQVRVAGGRAHEPRDGRLGRRPDCRGDHPCERSANHPSSVSSARGHARARGAQAADARCDDPRLVARVHRRERRHRGPPDDRGGPRARAHGAAVGLPLVLARAGRALPRRRRDRRPLRAPARVHRRSGGLRARLAARRRRSRTKPS